jgi:hypothetical protein
MGWTREREISEARDAPLSTIGRSIAGLLHLQRLVILRWPLPISTHILEPLLTLASLASLRLLSKPLPMEAMDVIRRLPHLKILHCGAAPSTEHVRRLLDGDAPIPPLELLPFPLDDIGMRLMRKLAPTLTHLDSVLPEVEPSSRICRR